MKKTLLAGLATGVLVFGVAVHANANLLTNGDFETGDFTGWTQGGDTSFTGVDASAGTLLPHSGGFFAFLGPLGPLNQTNEGAPDPLPNGTLSQDIATLSGHTYQVSFWLANDGDGQNGFSASFGSSAPLSLSDSPAFDYSETVFTFNEMATGFETLQFSFYNALGYFGLDDVSVTDITPVNNPVPEPAAMLLFGTGIAGLAGLRRRRKK